MRIRSAVADLAAALHTIGRGNDRLSDGRWLLWTGVLRVSLPVLKHALPLPRLVRLVRASAGSRQPALARRAGLLQQWVDRSSPLLSSNCLERSLVAYGTLLSGNADVALVVGFRRAGQHVQGHTWVERDGELVLEPQAPADAFSRTCAFDANGWCVPGGGSERRAGVRQAGVV
jgi:hypothetical protein